MRRDEVSNLVYDIFKVAEGFKHFMRRTSKLSARDTDLCKRFGQGFVCIR